MDERLAAGRRHLHAGRRALSGPRPREGRDHFEAALAEYRAPSLLLGEGDAHRGLAEVDLVEGDIVGAQTRIAAAFTCYDEVIERGADDASLVRAAIVGRTLARIVEAQLWLRTGRRNDAETQLEETERALGRLGDLRGQVDAQLALGRCALARSAPADAEAAIRKAIGMLERLADPMGLAEAWLFLGEVARASRRLDAADEATERAMGVATTLGEPHLIGRALTALGALRAQQRRPEEAEHAFDEALVHLDTPEAPSDAAGLARLGRGELWARQGRPGASAELASAIGRLVGASHPQGTAVALLKLAELAQARGLSVYALAMAEAARQWWRSIDPIHGVGLALRLQVKALADLRQWPAVVTLAWVRADWSGAVQPGALQIAEHYQQRAPEALVAELTAMSPDERWARADQHVQTILGPLLAQLDATVVQLGSPAATLALVEALSAATSAAPPKTPSSSDSAPDPSYSPPYFFSRHAPVSPTEGDQ